MRFLLAFAAVALLLAEPAVAEERYVSGELTVKQVWGRAAAVPGRPGSAYFTVTNAGADDDRLVAAESAAAERVELHEHRMEGNVMQMRAIDAIPVPAGETVTLGPGGLHVMLMEPTHPLAAGKPVPLTLVFERAGRVEVTVPLMKPGAQPEGHETDHHGH